MFVSKTVSSAVVRGLLCWILVLCANHVSGEVQDLVQDETVVKDQLLVDTTGWPVQQEQEWNPQEPSQDPLCHKPLPPENGYIKGDNYSYAAVVEVVCEAGYVLNGPSTLKCLPVSYPNAPGIWVPQDEYRCLPKHTNDMGATEATTVDVLHHSQRHHNLHSESASEDDTGDEAAPEEDDVTSYEDVRCPVPEVPENGEVVGTDYSMGATIHYECHAGFSLHGPQQANCLAVPDPFHHVAIWDPQTTPTCRPVPAAPPCLLPLSLVKDTPHAANLPPQSPYTTHRLQYTLTKSNEVEGLPSQCALPKDNGPCRMAIPRYYFDTALHECLLFTYGGCDGNDNNFETFEECQTACQ